MRQRPIDCLEAQNIRDEKCRTPGLRRDSPIWTAAALERMSLSFLEYAWVAGAGFAVFYMPCITAQKAWSVLLRDS